MHQITLERNRIMHQITLEKNRIMHKGTLKKNRIMHKGTLKRLRVLKEMDIRRANRINHRKKLKREREMLFTFELKIEKYLLVDEKESLLEEIEFFKANLEEEYLVQVNNSINFI